MSLSRAGKHTFINSVSNITEMGFWLLIDDKEYFVPFSDYPMFKRASVEQIFSVKQLSPTQFYWEEIDCDIELDALEKPEHFPLFYSD